MNIFNKTATLTATLASALALSACQSTPSSPVIQRANSIYETTGIAESKVKAQQKCNRQCAKNLWKKTSDYR